MHILPILLLGFQDPVEVKEVPRHNIQVEQTRFANLSTPKAGILSLNSNGIYFYEKNEGSNHERYQEGKKTLAVKTRAEDRHWLATGDFDGDGKEDIAYVVNHTLYVHKNTSESVLRFDSPGFVWELSHDKTADPDSFIIKDKENGFVADMNNDGLPDIVLNNASGCYVFQNKGNLFFETTKGPTIEFPRHAGEYGLEPMAYDWNNDGLQDILLGSSYGIFVALNNGTFSTPEKIAEVKTAPYTSYDMNYFINNQQAIAFPYVPQYTFEDTIIPRAAVVDGKKVPVVGTLFGFFTISDTIRRLQMVDERGNFMSRLNLAADDHPDFLLNDGMIVYATKAGLFKAKKETDFYRQQQLGYVKSGSMNDRAYLLPVHNGSMLEYVVGTSRQLQLFTVAEP